MDLRLPDGSGVEACREIRSQVPDAKVIILTSYADEDALFAAIMAGASGYVLKDLDPTRLQEAILTVGKGGSLLDPKMATTVLERVRKGSVRHPADDAFSTLSPQEDRILVFIGEGLTNREISEQFWLSEKTIKNYVSQIYSKLHVQRRSRPSGGCASSSSRTLAPSARRSPDLRDAARACYSACAAPRGRVSRSER
jgi:DNA-binding NarL/FixJ family response regulator